LKEIHPEADQHSVGERINKFSSNFFFPWQLWGLKMAGRNNGSKVVVIAVAATLTALGIGTVYVPFYADKDKLRGLHEEADGGLSERERREYEKYLTQIHHQQQQQGGSPADEKIQPDRSMPNGNSMWTRMNQAAAGKK
jgi:hypothetical protein